MTGFESLGFGYSNLPRHQKGGCTQDRDNEGIIAQHGPVTGCASCKNTAWHGWTTRAFDQTQMGRESASDDDQGAAADMAVIDVLGSQVDPQDGARSPADDQGPSSGKGRVGSEASRRSRAEAAEAAETQRLLTVDQIVPKSAPATDSAQRIRKVGHMHATCMSQRPCAGSHTTKHELRRGGLAAQALRRQPPPAQLALLWPACAAPRSSPVVGGTWFLVGRTCVLENTDMHVRECDRGRRKLSRK